MNIHLHIERLVLEGLPVTNAHGAAIQAAVQTGLARRLAEEGLPQMSAGQVENISGGQILLTTENNPAQAGHQIAQAVHSALTSRQAAPPRMGERGGRSR